MQHVDYVFDTLYIDQVYNLTLPGWTNKVYPEPMNYLRDMVIKDLFLDIFNLQTDQSRNGRKDCGSL